MTEFKQFIVERHPDPDTLFILNDDVFEPMCRLATEFAEKQVNIALGNVSNRRKLLNPFAEWLKKDDNHNLINKYMVDAYLESI